MAVLLHQGLRLLVLLVGLVLALSAPVEAQFVTPSHDVSAWQWSLDLLGARGLAEAGLDGDGIVMALLDSGVWAAHPDLGDVLWSNPDEPNDPLDPGSLLDPYPGDLHGWDFCAKAPRQEKPGMTHGTMVASLIVGQGGLDGVDGIAGIAPAAKIMDLKILCDGGQYPDRIGLAVDPDAVREALQYAIDHGADVINMSLQNWDDQGSGTPGASVDRGLFQEEFQAARDAGILVVVASGNAGAATPSSPGDQPLVLTVGATGTCDRRAAYSNRGEDLRAPGTSLVAASDGGHRWVQGTSFASPMVAAAGALWMQKDPTLSVEELHGRLRGSTKDQDGQLRLDLHGLSGQDPLARTAKVTWEGPTAASRRLYLDLSTSTPVEDLPLFLDLRVSDVHICMTTRDALQIPMQILVRTFPGGHGGRGGLP